MHVLGIDLGGTKLAAAIFDERGTLLFKELAALEGRKGDAVCDLLCEQIATLTARARSEGYHIGAAGFSVPGIYYAKKGHVWAPNIPGWQSYPLRDTLDSIAALRGARICIDSDRACYILGETWLGNAKGCRNAIFIAVGTGIGAGLLVDGNIVRGAHDIAGAVGWLALQGPYRREYEECGDFEYNASGTGLVNVARELLRCRPEYDGSLKDELSAPAIFAAFENNDPVATKVIDNAILYWGKAAANLVSLFDPEKIIFGGGVFGPATQFLDRIRREARKWAQPISISKVQFVVSALGGEAGLFGAGGLAWNEITRRGMR